MEGKNNNKKGGRDWHWKCSINSLEWKMTEFRNRVIQVHLEGMDTNFIDKHLWMHFFLPCSLVLWILGYFVVLKVCKPDSSKFLLIKEWFCIKLSSWYDCMCWLHFQHHRRFEAGYLRWGGNVAHTALSGYSNQSHLWGNLTCEMLLLKRWKLLSLKTDEDCKRTLMKWRNKNVIVGNHFK